MRFLSLQVPDSKGNQWPHQLQEPGWLLSDHLPQWGVRFPQQLLPTAGQKRAGYWRALSAALTRGLCVKRTVTPRPTLINTLSVNDPPRPHPWKFLIKLTQTWVTHVCSCVRPQAHKLRLLLFTKDLFKSKSFKQKEVDIIWLFIIWYHVICPASTCSEFILSKCVGGMFAGWCHGSPRSLLTALLSLSSFFWPLNAATVCQQTSHFSNLSFVCCSNGETSLSCWTQATQWILTVLYSLCQVHRVLLHIYHLAILTQRSADTCHSWTVPTVSSLQQHNASAMKTRIMLSDTWALF